MSLFKKPGKSVPRPSRGESRDGRPHIEQVSPPAAIPGGEFLLRGQNFTANGATPPRVRLDGQLSSLLFTSERRLVVRVPNGVKKGEMTVESSKGVSAPIAVKVGELIAEMVHPVANPAVDSLGQAFTTLSGGRGQKTPVSVFKTDTNRVMTPFLKDLLNATGLAFDRLGSLYISSRAEGTIYQVTPDGRRSVYAEGMGVATGIAFDAEENLYVGDRTGTIFKINRERQIFVFATLEPSVSAYHLAFGPGGHLYVTGPTTSSFDQIYRIAPTGEVGTFYRGLGRPQGMAFDAQGNLYVAASLAGRRGIIRLTPEAQAELFVSGYNIVGQAFTPRRSLVIATNESLVELALGIEGRPLLPNPAR